MKQGNKQGTGGQHSKAREGRAVPKWFMTGMARVSPSSRKHTDCSRKSDSRQSTGSIPADPDDQEQGGRTQDAGGRQKDREAELRSIR